ncbi:MAG: hypothetical protein LBL49_00015 [Clostridiales Family XIII bacterium]|nr:hypothetical protein [Clostridiales Family XIII bacterium]
MTRVEDMTYYKITLESNGLLTQLPDSQRLFGALVYMFSNEYGGDKATALAKALLDKSIHLALSNVLPYDYLPAPQESMIEKLTGLHGNTAVTLKAKHAEIKKRSYIQTAKLEDVLRDPQGCTALFPYVQLRTQQQLRASIESERYNIPALESKLYSVPIVEVLEVINEEQKKPVNTFCFLLQADGSDLCADLLNMLNEAVKTKQTIILGKRASQGLNIFKFSCIKDINEQILANISATSFLNTGMLLPDEINFASSTLKLFTSERRPFEMSGGWKKIFTRYYISFIAEGSLISAPSGSAGAGKSVKSCFNENRDIVFGNAFLYPISL